MARTDKKFNRMRASVARLAGIGQTVDSRNAAMLRLPQNL